jgi:dihydropteroate synthase type 2
MSVSARSAEIFGVVNVTRDSFSDGGRYLRPEDAIAHALALIEDGADVIDLGGAASNPAAESVSPSEEISRLTPIVAALRHARARISIDSFSSSVQKWALDQGVDYLNDINGFSDAALYPNLAGSRAKLVAMHSIQSHGKATVASSDPKTILARVFRFFDARVPELLSAGIGAERIVIDPGMGFFLGDDPECSLRVLRGIPELKIRYGLAVMLSVSRKSFLRKLARCSAAESGAATLTAEIFASMQGADIIRTHDVRALRQGLHVLNALDDRSTPLSPPLQH